MKASTVLEGNSFKVFIRVRPSTQKRGINENSDFQYDQKQIVLGLKNENQTFTFDKIYSPKSLQNEIFQGVANDIIDNAFLGINGTILCYGQTSSGKTHTIVGSNNTDKQDNINLGLLPRTISDLIQRKHSKIGLMQQSNIDMRIKISMVEIYNQSIKDLFNIKKGQLRLRQNKKQGVFVQNITQKYINQCSQAMAFISQGLNNRSVGKTNLNSFSSRSHLIFTITINQTNFQTSQGKSAKITLVDLAGSQNIQRSGAQGTRLLQAKKINTSLVTLSKVIQSLSANKNSHIAYRDSKLTRLLCESIGGNCLTRLIINVSSNSTDKYETLNSLRFGSRAKFIKNQPKVNKQYTVTELLALLEKAEIKIKKQMKIIENYKRRFDNQAPMSQKAITMHMIDDDYDRDYQIQQNLLDQQVFLSKSVSDFSDLKKYLDVSVQDKQNNMFAQTCVFKMNLQNSKAKYRAPNLKSSKLIKSMKSIAATKQITDEQNQFMNIVDLPSNFNQFKQKRKVKILQKNQPLSEKSILRQKENIIFDIPVKTNELKNTQITVQSTSQSSYISDLEQKLLKMTKKFQASQQTVAIQNSCLKQKQAQIEKIKIKFKNKKHMIKQQIKKLRNIWREQEIQINTFI